MISCREALENLSNYIDGEASAELHRAIEHHLGRCPRCWVVFDTTRQTLRIVTETQPFETPLAVSARLYSRLAQLIPARGPAPN